MKKIFLIIVLLAPLSVFSFSRKAPADTNKTDASGQKQGIWKEQAEGMDQVGNYVNNKKEGAWLSYVSQGQLTAITEYKNGKKNGVHVQLANGMLTMEEFYKEDSLHGLQRIYTTSMKPQIEAYYENGKLNGVRKQYYPDPWMLMEEAVYKNGLKNGVAKWYNTEGKLSIEYTYKNGNLEGPMRLFHKNRNIKAEGTYKNNELDGTYHEYHENGQLSVSGTYEKGKKEGAWKEFSDEGKQIKTEKYKDDKLVK